MTQLTHLESSLKDVREEKLKVGNSTGALNAQVSALKREKEKLQERPLLLLLTRALIQSTRASLARLRKKGKLQGQFLLLLASQVLLRRAQAVKAWASNGRKFIAYSRLYIFC